MQIYFIFLKKKNQRKKEKDKLKLILVVISILPQMLWTELVLTPWYSSMSDAQQCKSSVPIKLIHYVIKQHSIQTH